MKIILLGTGGPKPDPNRQGAGVLIEVDGAYLLFDTGRGVSTQLVRAGIRPQLVNPIFITHHHFDHIGSLGDLLLSAWDNGRQEPLQVVGPPGTAGIIKALLEQVYAADIRFRLAEAALSGSGLVDPRALIGVQEVGPGLVYEAEWGQVYAEHVDHGHGLGLARTEWPCYGYRLEAGGQVITISGDTVECPGLDRLAQGANVLILCCYLAEAEIIDAEHELIARHILASSGQVGKIASRAGVQTLVLTHFRQKPAAMMHTVAADVRQDFEGELYLGKDLMEIEI